MRPPPRWPASTMRPSWTSIQASRRLANRKRSCAWSSSRSPSTSGGGGSKWATPSPNDRRLKPSTAPWGIHDSEVTEDSMRMAGLPVSPSDQANLDGHDDANRPQQSNAPLEIQPARHLGRDAVSSPPGVLGFRLYTHPYTRAPAEVLAVTRSPTRNPRSPFRTPLPATCRPSEPLLSTQAAESGQLRGRRGGRRRARGRGRRAQTTARCGPAGWIHYRWDRRHDAARNAY